MIVPVLSMQLLDFSFLPDSFDFDLPLRTRIDCVAWRVPSVAVRLSSVSIVSGATISIGVMLEGPTADDPGATFVDTFHPQVDFNSTSLAPGFWVVSSLADVGSAIRVVARGIRGLTPGPIQAVVSIDVILKNG